MNMQQVIKPIGPFGQIIDQQLPFAEYLAVIRSTIKHARRHQPNLNSDMIIDANTPYEWHPVPFNKADHYKNGILLIHGLYDSPFSMRDIAQYFLQQGFFRKLDAAQIEHCIQVVKRRVAPRCRPQL